MTDTARIHSSVIVEACCQVFEVTESEVRGHGRDHQVVMARFAAIYLARTLKGMSFPEIGRRIVNRDHSTALYGFRKAKARIADNKKFSEQIECALEYVVAAAEEAAERDITVVEVIQSRKLKIPPVIDFEAPRHNPLLPEVSDGIDDEYNREIRRMVQAGSVKLGLALAGAGE